MSMSLSERAEFDALRERVRLLEGGAPVGQNDIAAAMADLSARLTHIETRSKPGPKPRGQSDAA